MACGSGAAADRGGVSLSGWKVQKVPEKMRFDRDSSFKPSQDKETT